MGKVYDGIIRTTFIIDEKGKFEDVITEVKTKEQIERIREASRILASILEFVLPRVKAGMSTKEIDENLKTVKVLEEE